VLTCCVSGVRAKASRSSATSINNVATVDNVGDFSLQKTISNIERLDTARLDDNDDYDDDNDDAVMPAVANEMGVGQYYDDCQ